MIYIKALKYEERATWGTCPVCEAQHREACAVLPDDVEGFRNADEDLKNGVHLARLFNAPATAAIDDGGQNDGTTSTTIAAAA